MGSDRDMDSISIDVDELRDRLVEARSIMLTVGVSDLDGMPDDVLGRVMDVAGRLVDEAIGMVDEASRPGRQ